MERNETPKSVSHGKSPAFSSFPTMFSTLSQTEIIILATFVVCKCFQFRPVLKFVVW